MRRLAIVLALAGCSSSGRLEETAMPPGSGSSTSKPAARGPKVVLGTQAGDIAVEVEVVDTWPKIEKGLMYREHLNIDSGMLFLMPEENDWGFYMRNTLIPLDMIFIGKDMKIAGIVENAVPRDETSRKVGKPSVYVLEVNGGWTKQHGVVAGATVRFDGVSSPMLR